MKPAHYLRSLLLPAVLPVLLSGCLPKLPDNPVDTGPFDADGDGVSASIDCDDEDAEVRAGDPWYLDADGDSYGDPDSPSVDVVCPGASGPDGYLPEGTDCDDTNGDVNPSAEELCNDRDDNCDGDTDQDAVDMTVWYQDLDGDGYGDPEASTPGCDQPSSYVDQAGDCEPELSAVNPDEQEDCTTAEDDDCDDDLNDVDALGCTTFYADEDRDGFGSEASRCLCSAVEPYDTTADSDCDDTTTDIGPDAVEDDRDGVDADCDGIVDENVVFALEEASAGTGVASPRALLAVDLDVDGRADLVAAGGSHLGIYWNRLPTYSFFNGEVMGWAGRYDAVAAARVDEDADLDTLAVSSAAPFLYDGSTNLVGYGDEITAGAEPAGIATGSCTGDDQIEVVAVTEYNHDDVTFWWNDGGGSWSSAGEAATGLGPTGIVGVPLDVDGMDFVVVNSDDDTISIVLTTLGACSSASDAISSTNVTALTWSGTGSIESIQEIVATDLDEDGDIDLAVTAAYDDGVYVFENTGTATSPSFVESSQIDLSAFGADANPAGLATGDFNGDGWVDIAVALSALGDVGLLMGNGVLGYDAAVTIATGGSPTDVAVADFDRDGYLDLVAGIEDTETQLWLRYR